MKTLIYAIGDIHGRRDLLDELLILIDRHAQAVPAARRVLVPLGDYVDRGPESAAVIDRLMEGVAGFEMVPLLGNHEQLLLDVVHGGDPSFSPQWLKWGGWATATSFGTPVRRGAFDALHLRSAIGVERLAWLRSLRTTFSAGDYLFVHAGIRPGVPLKEQSPEELIWIRELFLDDPRDHGFRVVHGHSIRPRPDILANRIGIDTGAHATGILTCAVIDPEENAAPPLLLQTRP